MIYFLLMDQSRKQTSRTMNANDNLVCQVFRSLEDLCSTDIARNPFIPFGGRSAVMCDESKFNHKTKYNRGRRIPAVWVFGILSMERSSARGYYKVVERRDRATLLPIIAECLQPGSEVHTDDWGAYQRLEQHLTNHVARYRVVVHAANFVDPNTGIHTQEVESSLANLKGVKRRKGVSKDDLQSYLDDRMWRQCHSGVGWTI